jgi:hypothetical protein
MGEHGKDDEDQKRIQSNGSFPKPVPPEDPGGKHTKQEEDNDAEEEE